MSGRGTSEYTNSLLELIMNVHVVSRNTGSPLVPVTAREGRTNSITRIVVDSSSSCVRQQQQQHVYEVQRAVTLHALLEICSQDYSRQQPYSRCRRPWETKEGKTYCLYVHTRPPGMLRKYYLAPVRVYHTHQMILRSAT